MSACTRAPPPRPPPHPPPRPSIHLQSASHPASPPYRQPEYLMDLTHAMHNSWSNPWLVHNIVAHCTTQSLQALVEMQASLIIPKGTTFEEYLSLSLPEDEVSEIPLSLKAMQASSSKKSKERGGALTDEEKVLLLLQCSRL